MGVNLTKPGTPNQNSQDIKELLERIQKLDNNYAELWLKTTNLELFQKDIENMNLARTLASMSVVSAQVTAQSVEILDHFTEILQGMIEIKKELDIINSVLRIRGLM